jgi:transcriptional regulator with XRE-family HTH domain
MSDVHPIRVWRKENKIRLWQLAERAGSSVSHLADVETGRSVPSLALAARLAGATGLSLEAISAFHLREAAE